MSVVAQDRQNVIYMYGGLLCQSELSCMRLIRPWFCSESVHCSSCIVVNLLCHTCILLCLPVDVFLNAIKRKQKSSTEEKGFFSVSLFTYEEKTVDLCNSVRQRKAVYYHRGY